jgi:hypothetical protein
LLQAGGQDAAHENLVDIGAADTTAFDSGGYRGGRQFGGWNR